MKTIFVHILFASGFVLGTTPVQGRAVPRSSVSIAPTDPVRYEKLLKDHRADIQNTISQAAAVGALVVIPRSEIANMVTIPASTPLEAASKESAVLRGARHCWFVYARNRHLATHLLACEGLLAEAEIAAAREKTLSELRSALAQLRIDYLGVSSRLLRVVETQQKQEVAIETAHEEILSMSNSLSLAEQQGKLLRELAQTLIESQNNDRTMIAKNNEVLDQLWGRIGDSRAALVRIEKLFRSSK